ncbi:uncharacterized protein PHALS_06627 [Plasmopara halstedii]|uniref:Uncharacterized protein n=1 Tax=Plasmopara halstedii TaxID=4781 RepID=A0A0N7L842_PLAHL|nr:uncharacterized protein PHALS_06627 [Plasmopara halstedii]CEG48827.1 hypothetical protein PHALS_06627 [Plasmopara halstedii]|eukprot:XP_024585196.1 hypothetical protein PHALS_06627 [Plasmopara halstedii]
MDKSYNRKSAREGKLNKISATGFQSGLEYLLKMLFGRNLGICIKSIYKRVNREKTHEARVQEFPEDHTRYSAESVWKSSAVGDLEATPIAQFSRKQ